LFIALPLWQMVHLAKSRRRAMLGTLIFQAMAGFYIVNGARMFAGVPVHRFITGAAAAVLGMAALTGASNAVRRERQWSIRGAIVGAIIGAAVGTVGTLWGARQVGLRLTVDGVLITVLAGVPSTLVTTFVGVGLGGCVGASIRALIRIVRTRS